MNSAHTMHAMGARTMFDHEMTRNGEAQLDSYLVSGFEHTTSGQIALPLDCENGNEHDYVLSMRRHLKSADPHLTGFLPSVGVNAANRSASKTNNANLINSGNVSEARHLARKHLEESQPQSQTKMPSIRHLEESQFIFRAVSR
jgi:hypothetical protein